MNREEKVARLQSLLDRVQTRAKEGRPPRAVAAAVQVQQAAIETGLGFDIAPVGPVAMPTTDPFEADETRPFAKMPSKHPVRPVVPAIPEAKEPPPLDELDEIMLEPEDEDDVGSGGLEIVDEAPVSEPPASSRRAVVDSLQGTELDIAITEEPDAPRVTPPPESGPQEVAPRVSDKIEVDFERVASVMPRGAGEQRHPSVEMVGQTVELEEGPVEGVAELELDEGPKPPATPSTATTAEMEAVIPGASAPGRYPPEEDAGPPTAKPGEFLDEPLTNDWVLPDDKEIGPSVELDKVEPAPVEPAPVELDKVAHVPPISSPERSDTERPGEAPPEAAPAPPREMIAAVTMVAEAGPTDAAPQVVEVKPITVELAGAVIKGPTIHAEDIAVFVGAVKSAEAHTFMDLLDASLGLGLGND